MAYKIEVTLKFEKSTAKTFQWLLKEWSERSAASFKVKVAEAIQRIGTLPKTGRISSRAKNIRSVPVTKHNRIYYRILKDKIQILDIIELKQDPKGNKYE